MCFQINAVQFVIFGGGKLLLGVLILNSIFIRHCLPMWMSKSTIQKTAPG